MLDVARCRRPARPGRRRVRAPPDGPTSSSPRPAGGPIARCSLRPPAAGVPVWGEVELAWRLRARRDAGAVARRSPGTNGKTTTVRMLASMLARPGAARVAAGNVGLPLRRRGHSPSRAVRRARRRAVQLPAALDVLDGARCAAAVLNVARGPPRLARLARRPTPRDKGRIYERTRWPASTTSPTRVTEQLVREADVAEGCRAIGFTLGRPVGRHARRGRRRAGRPGLRRRARDLRRRARHRRRRAARRPRTTSPTRSPRRRWPARTASPPAAVRDGLRAFAPGAHRIAHVATVDGVAYVDDSKATNPHAAAASLRRYDSVVWVAGGLAKGADLRRPRRRSAPTGCAASC